MVKWCIQRDCRIAIYSGFLTFQYKHHEIRPNRHTTAAPEREQPCVRLRVGQQRLPLAVPAIYHLPGTAAHLLRPGRNQGSSPYRSLSFSPTREKESRLASPGGQEMRGGSSRSAFPPRLSPASVTNGDTARLCVNGRRSSFNPVRVSKGICRPTRRKKKKSRIPENHTLL